MRAAPGRFVGQRRVMPSTVPVIEGDELRPRSLVLRAFVVADDENDGAMKVRVFQGRSRDQKLAAAIGHIV